MNKKGFINIIIIGVVVLILAAAGYFVMTRKTSEAPTTTQEVEDLTTKDWKTYRNKEYGFEFKYPHNWVLINENEEIKKNNPNKKLPYDALLHTESPDYKNTVIMGQESGASFVVTSKQIKVPVVECDNYPGLGLPIGECSTNTFSKIASIVEINGTNVEINGTKALKRSQNGISEIIIYRGQTLYSLNFMWSENYLQGDTTFDQILSTFKFIE